MFLLHDMTHTESKIHMNLEIVGFDMFFID